MTTEKTSFAPSDRVRQTALQTSCELGAERVVLNVDSGIYYGLDPVGGRIWDLLAEERAVSELEAILLEEYDVEPGALGGDLQSLLTHLLEAGLIEVLPSART